MVVSVKKSVAATLFQKNKAWTAAIRPVLYGYEIKAKYGHPSKFQLIYGVFPRMNNDETFPLSGIPDSLWYPELEMVSTVSLRVSKKGDKKGS